jgi:hypothetical protein
MSSIPAMAGSINRRITGPGQPREKNKTLSQKKKKKKRGKNGPEA